MNLECGKPDYRLICAAVAAGLALSLAACGDKSAPADVPATAASAADAAAREAKEAALAAEKLKTVVPMKAVDEKAAANSALAAKVKAAILATPSLKYMAMDVRASDGAVTLFGTADTEAQRRQAEKVAAGIAGAKSVKNELKIVRGS